MFKNIIRIIENSKSICSYIDSVLKDCVHIGLD